jgi:hypothetical protein
VFTCHRFKLLLQHQAAAAATTTAAVVRLPSHGCCQNQGAWPSMVMRTHAGHALEHPAQQLAAKFHKLSVTFLLLLLRLLCCLVS